ncbi:hypothetical protein AJ78_04406 [Emergomyces pasteurianus Ep9510]|uniref:Uncharacterized protein n=1 Tax=Emergomyces pasteurianus Ep9510 TaxID=1447872 RepID=A0A1J9PHD9_9EURO|nr:hypothetical protein AJ78_04406 [Emergomyces pasteurianus Ep9510]
MDVGSGTPVEGDGYVAGMERLAGGKAKGGEGGGEGGGEAGLTDVNSTVMKRVIVRECDAGWKLVDI